MPNIIDSLTVELKLDATNFDRGQKRTTDDFEKTKKKLNFFESERQELRATVEELLREFEQVSQ